MSAGNFDVDYVAHLARLDLTPEEQARMAEQLHQILGYMEKLRRVDVNGVEPTAHPAPLVNVTRADEVAPGLTQAEALGNAPANAGGLFIVPKIVE